MFVYNIKSNTNILKLVEPKRAFIIIGRLTLKDIYRIIFDKTLVPSYTYV